MGQARSSIVQIPSEYQRDLLWSFQPIFYLMRILGIDLDVSEPHSKFRRLVFITIAVLMLAYSITSNSFWHHQLEIAETEGTTTYWVAFLRELTITISGILIPSILVAVTIFRWNPVWKKLHKIENSVNFQKSLLMKMRRTVACTCTMVISFFIWVKLYGYWCILWVELYGWTMFFQDLVIWSCSSKIVRPNSTMAFNIFTAIGAQLTDLYIYLSVILFTCLTCVASDGIQIIIDDVPSQSLMFHSESSHRVRKWRRSYGLIYDFVEEVDRFFGPILLVFFARKFIVFVITVFQLILLELNMTDDRIFIAERIVYFTKVTVYIPTVAFRSHKMKQQVIC